MWCEFSLIRLIKIVFFDHFTETFEMTTEIGQALEIAKPSRDFQGHLSNPPPNSLWTVSAPALPNDHLASVCILPMMRSLLPLVAVSLEIFFRY